MSRLRLLCQSSPASDRWIFVPGLDKGVGVGLQDDRFEELGLRDGEFLRQATERNFGIGLGTSQRFVDVFLRRTKRQGTGSFDIEKGAILDIGKVGNARLAKLFANFLFHVKVQLSRLLDNGLLFREVGQTATGVGVALPVINIVGTACWCKKKEKRLGEKTVAGCGKRKCYMATYKRYSGRRQIAKHTPRQSWSHRRPFQPFPC